MKTYFPQSSRLAYFLAAITLLVAGMAKQAAAATDVASTLNADPQFSDFVTELKFAGLWPSLEGLQGVTVFAPTNAAFDKTGTAWRADILSEGNFQANGRGTVWQQGLLSAFIQGVHNTNDFAGKTQRVHSLGSTVYWVDGKPGSAIRVQDRPPVQPEMGQMMAPPSPKTAQLSSPIVASNGLIYPMDTILR